MQVKPVKSDAEHKRALLRIQEIWNAPEGSPEGDELDVLATLVEKYEDERYPMDLPDPIEAIKFRLEQEGKDYSALIGVIGQRTRVYEVMRRARPLSLRMIRNLHRELKIPADVLIRPATRPRRRIVPAKKRRNGMRKSA